MCIRDSTWTTADDCGNASSCVQIVTVVDNEAPVITCPDDTTVECLSAGSGANCIADFFTVIVSTDPSNTGSATATDNCDSPSVSYSDTLTSGTCPQENVITRSWTAADGCANSSSCDQVIIVVDNTAPIITCPADVTVDCEDDSSSAGTGSASATDNCDNDVTVTESDSVAGGTCAQESVITRTWSGTDDCGNASSCYQTIKVVDNGAL